MGGMGILINNITKGGMSSAATAVVVHKPQSHDLRSRKNTLSSEDLASSSMSESEDGNGGIYCNAGNAHVASKKKNANGGIIPGTRIAVKTGAPLASELDPSSQSDGSDAKATLSQRWVPKKSGSRRGGLGRANSMKSIKKSSGLFSSFTAKKRPSTQSSRESLTIHQEESSSFSRNSSWSNDDFTTLIQEGIDDEQFKQDLEEERASTQQQQPHVVEGRPSTRRPPRRPSVVSSDGESFSEELLNNDLDIESHPMDSISMLSNLGDTPTSSELANVAAIRAKEYINECVETVLDRKNWDSIPQYSKSELMIRKHLGKGSFSDAYEVSVMVTVEDDAEDKLDVSDKDDLDRLIEAKFAGNSKKNTQDNKEDLIRNLHSSTVARFHNEIIQEGEEDDLDKQIDEMFGSSNHTLTEAIQEDGEDETIQEDEEGDLDKEIDDLFGDMFGSSNIVPTKINPQEKGTAEKSKQDFRPGRVMPRGIRRKTIDNGVSASFCISKTTSKSVQKRQMTYAMKCLRPQIRSDVSQFIIGVEDLVHETAILASLDHPNIVKLHGRAISNSSRLSDGYFILLDKLEDTLEERMGRWKNQGGGSKSPPSVRQLKAACSIADALSYLHSKNIVFRDLKPANVGFDSRGELKLFDFGFAISNGPSNEDGVGDCQDESCLLYDKCGTPRYMAPEVYLETGYGLSADVHSFGILLWEICALKKPFAHVKSSIDLHKSVFEKGARPKLSKHWPEVLNETMRCCWGSSPGERPSMKFVRNVLSAHVRDVSMSPQQMPPNGASFRKSAVFLRRLTG